MRLKTSFVNKYLLSHGFLKMKILKLRAFLLLQKRKKRKRYKNKILRYKKMRYRKKPRKVWRNAYFYKSFSVGYKHLLNIKRGLKRWRFKWNRHWNKRYYRLQHFIKKQFLKFSTLILKVMSKLILTYFNLNYFFLEKKILKAFFIQLSRFMQRIFSLKKAYKTFCHRYLGFANKKFAYKLLFRFQGVSMLRKVNEVFL